MKTTSQLIGEVESELNAMAAADKGMEAVIAFAQEAERQFAAGDVIKTKEALTALRSLAESLRKAIPANVTPATAGPVGKSPKEHYLDEAHDIAENSLKLMKESLEKVHGTLAGISEAIEHAARVKVAGLTRK